MDIAQIHVGSLAIRVAQVAAAELAAHLQDTPAVANEIWFDPTRTTPEDDTIDYELAEREKVLDELGEYVCSRRIELGETLYRHAVSTKLVTSIGAWSDLSPEQRQPWELFVSTCREVFGNLRTVQLATIDARRQVAADASAHALKLEDSIFETETGLDELRPEAVESLRQTGAYHRAHGAELRAARQTIVQILAQRVAVRAQFNGADPAKFDHDGDGRPGGVKRSAIEKSIDRQARKTPPAAPLSVGEPPPRPPVNRGGRGRKKAR